MESGWIDRRVISYAHRGGSFEAPSSTIGALEQACKAGVSALELDVHSTADGVLVCCHDDVLETTTSGRGKISKVTWDEIARLNAGYWFVPNSNASSVLGRPEQEYIYRDPALAGNMTRLARVEEVLELFPNCILNFDIKSTAPSVEPYEEKLARLILDHQAQDRVIVGSFLDSAIWRLRQANFGIATAAAPGEISEFYFAVASGFQSAVDLAWHSPYVAFQIPRFHGEIQLATKEFIAASHAAGKAVHIWTVNDKAEMETLIDLGVDGIMSDLPSVMVPVIERKATHYLYAPN